jgi:hypothetical protein
MVERLQQCKDKKVRLGSRKRPPQIEAQVGRIRALLTELEELSPPSTDVSTALIQARAIINEVEKRASLGAFAADDAGDAQPHLDRECWKATSIASIDGGSLRLRLRREG